MVMDFYVHCHVDVMITRVIMAMKTAIKSANIECGLALIVPPGVCVRPQQQYKGVSPNSRKERRIGGEMEEGEMRNQYSKENMRVREKRAASANIPSL
jgi:hypothetical protein